jgi:hypothetical protein
MSGTLALGNEPPRSGFERSVGRVGAVARSADAGTGRLAPRSAPIWRVSAEEPLPMPPVSDAVPEPVVAEPAVLEPARASAPVRTQLAGPAATPMAQPASAAYVPHGASDVQYLSSAWPGNWQPPVCSDIAFRPLGDAVMPIIGRQIYHGAIDLMTLYDFDFHNPASDLAASLTPRGLYQLRKFAGRLQYTQAPITVQFSELHPELAAARRERVVQELAALGIANADALVVLGRARFGVPGTQAIQTAAGLESVIENRGRTVTPDSSARFGTGRSFRGFGR